MKITSKLNNITIYPIKDGKVWTGTDICRSKSDRKQSWDDKTYQVINRLKQSLSINKTAIMELYQCGNIPALPKTSALMSNKQLNTSTSPVLAML